MSKEKVLENLKRAGVIAVIRGPSVDLTLKMVEALIAGGINSIEITYTTPNAPQVAYSLDRRFGVDILLGMGTLTLPAQAQEAKDAGARFIVSPHCEEDLASAMVATNLPVMMGAFTPTEIVASHRLGSSVVKLFPGSLGGPKYLKSIRGPFPDIPIMPTGGVSADNVNEWYDAGAVAVGAGSNLCPAKLATEGNFKEITARAKGYIEAIDAYRNRKA
jgi:2-dehydro-3-deoxyphosphogluconate aldolase/(4S)-4-hydroxy-2-oxoglutarate aldolase